MTSVAVVQGRQASARAAACRALARESLIVLAFAVLTVAMTWPWARMIRDAVPDPGDAYLNSWILWWDYHQTFHDPLNLFHAPILFPHRYTLAFSENNYGISLLFFPLFALGVRPITVQGVATLVGFILSGYGAFRLVRTLLGSNGAAWVAGLAFGFALYRFHQVGHLNYMFCGWIPLLLEALVLFTRRRSWRRAGWLGIAFAMNALTCIHWFVLTLIPLGLSGAFLLTRYRIWRDRDVWMRGGAGLVAAGLALLPVLLPYWYVAHTYGMVRGRQESALFSARVGNWLSADPSNQVWRGFGPVPEAGERALFPGILPLLLLAAALYFARPGSVSASAESHGEARRPRRVVQALDVIALACLAVMLLASGGHAWGIRTFGLQAWRIAKSDGPLMLCVVAVLTRCCIGFPGGFRFEGHRNLLGTIRAARRSEALALGLLWTVIGFCGSLGMNFFFHRFLFDYVVLFRSVRVPARWGMLAYLGIAILAGLGARGLVEALRRRLPRLRSLPVYVIIGSVLLFEQRAAPLRLVHGEVDPDALTVYFGQTAMRGGIVHLPAGGEDGNYRYVLRQADHQRPLVTAVSGFATPLLTEIESLSRRQPIPDRFFDVLEATPVSYLAVHRAQLRPEARVFVEYMLVRGVEAGRLRYVRSFAGTGINGNDGADLYAVSAAEPEARAAAELPFAPPPRSWHALIERDPVNVLGRYQNWSRAVYRVAVASYGRMPRFAEFLADMESMSRDIRLDVPEEPTQLERAFRGFVDGWVERAKFRDRYRRADNREYVDALTRHAEIALAPAERASFIDGLDHGVTTRSRVLLAIVQRPDFARREELRSLVLLHYFGYLRRDPDDPPDNGLDGFNYWLREVEGSGDIGKLPRAFLASGEYRDARNR